MWITEMEPGEMQTHTECMISSFCLFVPKLESRLSFCRKLSLSDTLKKNRQKNFGGDSEIPFEKRLYNSLI